MSTVSSATVVEATRSYFLAFTQPTTTAPDVSCRSPLTTESETVITVTRIMREAGSGTGEAASQSASVFIERHLHTARGNSPTADLDLQSGSFRGGSRRH